MASTEKKDTAIQLETIGNDPDPDPDPATVTEDKIDSYGLLKSRYDELSILRTLWVFKRVIFVSLAVYTGYLCEGFELNAGGSVIANAGFIKQFGDAKSTGVRALDPTWVSTWSALLNVGQLLTFTYVSWFADRFGRKPSFYVAWIWLVVVSATYALAKLCNGAGIGVLQIVCQVYIMEICPNRIRGGMVVFQSVWGCIGGIIVAVMMQQLNKKHPDNYLVAMRILWGPIAFMIVCWAFVPESPWHHARKGEKEKAIKALKKLFGGVDGYDFEEEYAIISRTIEHEQSLNEEKPRFRDVFRGLNLKRASIVIILSISQQLAGLAIISTYSTCDGVFKQARRQLISWCRCCNLAAVLFWSLTADYLGRRVTLNTCQTLVCVILVIVGSLYWTGATHDNAAAGTALIVAISYYLYSAELPTALLRIKTGPITFFMNSITGIATCYATPPMLLHMSLRAAFVYFAFSVPICIVMWLYVPETKGRSAAEIDELYERKVPAWRWASTRTAAEEQMEAVVQVKGRVKQA
ncbi:uncharacterized protein MYCFIDRAFT_198401 [Pseudocercospora fijiensis CIRAD86]|uniref:Major facilitator superfamily (MFS) profile domain-containing protein n=1 Tax=Pseudocercospora fijiensis (strain CIRAD86) TaxID=383855 RepID=M3ARK4_PSEFD|nr:uncharacterized protein MYCFIDRAFT_198401 [Pseudocercospora fijiensis CIRAD86]EME80067.1 hypothetical protein MYCFIDRAFT_198401 [Pseudocercospora fijiensis CIRAD86]